MSQITHNFHMNTQSPVTIILKKVAHKTYSNQRQFNLSLTFFVSAFTLDWLRLNYIEIFHYLVNQYKGTPIFEYEHRKIDKNKEIGGVFNDFDFQSDELLSSTHNDYLFNPPRISGSCRIRGRQT